MQDAVFWEFLWLNIDFSSEFELLLSTTIRMPCIVFDSLLQTNRNLETRTVSFMCHKLL